MTKFDIVDRCIILIIGAALVDIAITTYTRYPVFLIWAGVMLILFGVTRK